MHHQLPHIDPANIIGWVVQDGMRHRVYVDWCHAYWLCTYADEYTLVEGETSAKPPKGTKPCARCTALYAASHEYQSQALRDAILEVQALSPRERKKLLAYFNTTPTRQEQQA